MGAILLSDPLKYSSCVPLFQQSALSTVSSEYYTKVRVVAVGCFYLAYVIDFSHLSEAH